jgi:hypothetical protein
MLGAEFKILTPVLELSKTVQTMTANISYQFQLHYTKDIKIQINYEIEESSLLGCGTV